MEETVMSPSLALPFTVTPIKLALDNKQDPDPMNQDSISPSQSAPIETRSDQQSDEDSISIGPSIGSPTCSVNSDCSSIASSLEDFSVSFPDGSEPVTITGTDLILPEAPDLTGADLNPIRTRSVFLLDYIPLWGFTSIIGRRPEMEDAVRIVPNAFEIPLRMLTGETGIDGLDSNSFKVPAHFFGVYDGHGGAQVANYCRERMHKALIEELNNQDEVGTNTDTFTTSTGTCTAPDFKKRWERAFVNCFTKVDDEVAGKREKVTDIAPETVGSTAVVAVICNSHVIVANCGDSRAVLCRGKLPIPLSIDHKPNREDEYARIEAAGGKVIQWNGYRVFGVLAMSRSIGDRYLKPWIIPDPEVTMIPRAKDDECLILASDGLWDVISNEEACDMARKRILLWHKKNGPTNSNLSNSNLNLSSDRGGEYSDPAAQAAAEGLAKLAIQKGSKDNITVVVIDLKAQRKFKVKS